MQGKKLIPVITTSAAPASGRAPQTDGTVIARSMRSPARRSRAAELAAHGLAVGGAVMGRDVDQRGFHLLCAG